MGLPPLFDAWVQSLGVAAPNETQATCDDCAMCRSAAEPAGQAATAPAFFDPRTKCCTYFPTLPNFLVGRILNETDPNLASGRKAVADLVAAGVGVTPAALGSPPQHSLLYRGMKSAFGRSLTMRCPYYVEQGGQCGIWKHRDAVCSTYFCKHDRGAVGARVWQALTDLLLVVSEALSGHCVLELGLGEDATRRFAARRSVARTDEPDPNELDGRRRQDHDRMWGDWRGREAEFYSACAGVVEAIAPAEALALAGARGRVFAVEAANAYRALASDEVPERLCVGEVAARPGPPGTVYIKGYRPSDELAAPSFLLEMLTNFDGRPVAEVLAAIEQETGVILEHDLVRKLVDFEILVSASS